MSDNGASGRQVTPTTVQARVVELRGVTMQAGPHPLRAGARVLMLGPLMLAIPLDDQGARALVQALTGVVLPASPAVMPQPPEAT